MIKPGAKKALSVKKHLFIIAGLFLFLWGLFEAGNSSQFVETYYTHGLYPIISCVLHLPLGWIPFSVGDLLYTAIIIYLIYFLWKLLSYAFHKKLSLLGFGSLRLLIGIQIFISLFYLLWGMNYSRPAAAQILNLTDTAYTINELTATTKLLIDSTNIRRAALQTTDQQTNNAAIYQSAVQAVKQLGQKNKAFCSYFPAAKPAIFTPLINYLGLSGYFNPFTGEAQVNYNMPLVNRPVTACHEMAHQMGYAREDEANFVGFLAGINSTDRLLKYSAYYLAMEEFLRQVRRRDTVLFNQLKTKISVPVKQDMKADREYWIHYQSQLSYATGLFYDQFLKANKQPEGLRSYNRMINLTLAYYGQGKKLKEDNP